MKAISFVKGGDASVLHYGELDQPVMTSPRQVLVRLYAAGINPIDTKVRAAPDRFPVCTPTIPGCDGAGIIEAVGEAVTHLNAGDEVYFSQPGFNTRQGTYAEYAVVDAALVAHKPKRLDFIHAAAVPLVAITAWEALFDRARLQAGQRALIHAGAGGVGHVAIQLAHMAGAKVITTISSALKAEFATSLGAEHCVNYTQQDIQQAVLRWSNGEGVDVSFDTVGGKVLEQSFPCTKVYGDVVSILQPDASTNWGQARVRNLRFSLELMLSPVMLELEQAMTHQGEILRQVAAMIDEGKLDVHLAKVFSLEQASQAHQYLEQQHPSGKVVLSID